ncbi:MAG: S-layer homology domain-containing protein [Clostridia bacterium]|nr:S-layer homology domain-containing protein [Clostridia bacterium]
MRNLKKVIALVAVFAMLVSTVAFAQTYSDVASTDTYAEAIETLSALGILTGDDADNDGKMDFRPADTITRAEVAAIVCRIQGMNAASQTTTPFADVPSSHWASGYVAQAAGQGIVNGYGDGNFGPDDNVLYEQVVKMLMETLGYNLFAADNGGYPTGYLTAAQRYKVLDGVVGGSTGVEANRGMVAQMVYNAIDTPVMDKYSYGKDATYMIYDGNNGLAYTTLLSRNLKLVKANGTVTANSYSNGIDLEIEKKVEITLSSDEVNTNYLNGYVSIDPYQGDVDADPLLGYAVNAYAKKNNNGTYTLVAIAKDSATNTEASFDVDTYQSLSVGAEGKTSTIYYEKENGSKTPLTIAANYTVIFNGVKLASTTLDEIFGGENYITTDNTNNLTGKVTLVDTAKDAGYEVVKVEIATTAVVNKAATNGQISFLNGVSIPSIDSNGAFKGLKNLPYLKFDAEDTSKIIELTKDGEAVDYTELNKWDVLTILAVDGVGIDYTTATVLSESNYVDGYVAAVRSDGDIQLSDGNVYEVASNKYPSGGLQPGDSGRFYIDAYGKLVALDDDVVVEGVSTTAGDNYAFVLDAAGDSTDTWGKPAVKVLLLDKTGALYEAQLAATNVDLINLNVVDAGLAKTLSGTDDTTDDGDFSVNVEELTQTNTEKLATALATKLISYTSNSQGQITAVTFAQSADEEEDMFLKSASEIEDGKYIADAYDADDMEIDGVEIDEDTYVFYITNAVDGGTVQYGESATKASSDYSRVVKGADLVEGDYAYVAFDTAEGAAKALVILNTTGEIAPSANVAVINSIGETKVNGNDAWVVEFYMNGELQTATTATDLKTITKTNAKRGDVFQLNVSNGVITAANEIMDYTARTATAGVTNGASPALTGKSSTVFGAVSSISNRGNLNLTLNGVSKGSISAADAENANVYVIDPNLTEKKQLYVGSFSEAYVNEDITKNNVDKYIKVDYEDDAFGIEEFKLGTDNTDCLLDYAFAYEYDGDAIDIVIYKALEFDYTINASATLGK